MYDIETGGLRSLSRHQLLARWTRWADGLGSVDHHTSESLLSSAQKIDVEREPPIVGFDTPVSPLKCIIQLPKAYPVHPCNR
jgi:hypothetical protein